MKRKTGYYWVKITSISEWEPALWAEELRGWLTLARNKMLWEDGVWEVGGEIVKHDDDQPSDSVSARSFWNEDWPSHNSTL